jgi:S-adenosylmethionine:tRNA-ribosyltransferase-isomerase (queuine synthetase)
MKNYYEILDLSSDAEPEKIRKQYRLLVISCHPDKFTHTPFIALFRNLAPGDRYGRLGRKRAGHGSDSAVLVE